MSAMFWFIAGVATGVAATFVAIPLWRLVARGASGRTPLQYAIVGCGVAIFAVAAALIYHFTGQQVTSAEAATAAAAPAGKAQSIEAATAGLEARLARQGGSASDWTLLAQSYEFLGRTADAQRARERASGAPPATGAEPGGLAAGMPATGTPAAANTNIALVWETAAGASPSQGVAGPAANAPVEIDGTVTIEQRLAARVDRNATLFIYAKAVDAPGPPLAVMRTTAGSWPVTFHLDDSMAMVPSRKLSQFDKVVIEARISHTGQATPASGDLYVTSDVLRPTAGKKLTLVINREIG